MSSLVGRSLVAHRSCGLKYWWLRDMWKTYVRWRTREWWKMRAMTCLLIPSLYACSWGRTQTPKWRFLKGGGQSSFCRIGHLFLRAASTPMLSASCCRLMAQTDLVSPLLAKFPTLHRNLSLSWATWTVPLRCILLLPLHMPSCFSSPPLLVCFFCSYYMV